MCSLLSIAFFNIFSDGLLGFQSSHSSYAALISLYICSSPEYGSNVISDSSTTSISDSSESSESYKSGKCVPIFLPTEFMAQYFIQYSISLESMTFLPQAFAYCPDKTILSSKTG